MIWENLAYAGQTMFIILFTIAFTGVSLYVGYVGCKHIILDYIKNGELI